jgi:hypothetical protein
MDVLAIVLKILLVFCSHSSLDLLRRSRATRTSTTLGLLSQTDTHNQCAITDAHTDMLPPPAINAPPGSSLCRRRCRRHRRAGGRRHGTAVAAPTAVVAAARRRCRGGSQPLLRRPAAGVAAARSQCRGGRRPLRPRWRRARPKYHSH